MLGGLICKRRNDGLWRSVKVVEGVDVMSHLQFVDDTFLMGETLKREARVMK